MEEIVIHQRGTFDLAAEVDVFAAHLQYQLRTARNHQLLITHKTIVNVLAYARMLLDVQPDTVDAAVLDAMETFCRAWAPTYDNTVPYSRAGVEQCRRGEPFGLQGWPHLTDAALAYPVLSR